MKVLSKKWYYVYLSIPGECLGISWHSDVGDAYIEEGGYLALDGDNDAVEIPLIGTFNRLTYAMWVYPTVDLVPLEFSGGMNTNGWDAGAVHFKLNYGKLNVGINGLGSDLVGTTVVEPNKWSHIALTISEKEVALYLNGELENSRTLATPVTNLIVGSMKINGWKCLLRSLQ